ncbi:MAG: hypothetical protein HUK22_05880 [Thermoguttaceae bacterium]|nr:hypothetical protein [Thermoguttaceae bacterium]
MSNRYSIHNVRNWIFELTYNTDFSERKAEEYWKLYGTIQKVLDEFGLKKLIGAGLSIVNREAITSFYKTCPEKDLGMMAVSYGTCFVGQISLGANPVHAVKTLVAAESYNGPSLVIAYAHCIAQGIDMKTGMELQKEAVKCGYWPLWSYDPRLEKPFVLASKAPEGLLKDFEAKQNRFKSLKRINPDAAAQFEAQAQEDIYKRYEYYKALQEVKKN